MLELKNITKVYEAGTTQVEALKGINIAFRENEFVAILGQSGCGKTTLLNIIGGLDRYTSGDLIINGRSTKEYDDRDWDTYRNHSIGFVFQSYNLIPHQSVLANVDLDDRTFRSLVKENRAAIACYDGLNIAEASKLISSVERQIGLIQQEHIASSILAIKLAAGVTHLLIDIPVGPKSRIKSTNEAMRLRKLIEYVGDMLSMEIDVVITDGSEPIGNGVGAVLEARDVMKVLRNKEDAPQDLLEKSLFLAGRLLEFDPKLRGGQGYHVAKEILTSGRALEVMNRIIHAQGKAPQPQLGHLTRDIISNVSGVVEAIDNSRINKIGVWAGAGQYPGAGLDLLKKVGDPVEQGETLYRIHSCNSTDFAFANSVVDGYTGYEISGRQSNY